MKEIIFVTSNEEKVKWACKKLEKYKIKVIQKRLDIPEVREFETEKVAVEKAKHAIKYVQKPFIVDDTGFQIACLKNFPGTYLKLVLSTIGVKGLCKLAKEEKNKETNFKSALAYVDEKKEIHTFTCNDFGTIADEPKGELRKEWGDLMKIHLPLGFGKTLAEMNEGEFREYEKKMDKQDHYVQLGDWIVKENK